MKIIQKYGFQCDKYNSESGERVFLFLLISISKMLTRISVCGISSGKLIKVTVVLCWAIILKLSTSGLAEAELVLL